MIYFIEDNKGYFADKFSIYYADNKYTYCAATHINGIEFYLNLEITKKILNKLNDMKNKAGFNLNFKIKEKKLGEIKNMPVLKHPYIYRHSIGV